MSERVTEDRCLHCDVPDNPVYYDIESEHYFTCSDCPCCDCPDLHECCGQCVDPEKPAVLVGGENDA